MSLLCTTCGSALAATLDPTAPTVSCPKCLAALLTKINGALAGSTTRVAGVFPRKRATLPVGAYTATTVSVGGVTWAACRGQQDSNAARLLDATVAHRTFVGAPHAVAILQPPAGASKHDRGTDEYLRAYQAAAWHGCGVLFLREGAPVAEPAWQLSAPPVDHRRFLDALESDIRAALAAPEAIPSDFLHSSTDAECIVRPIVHRLLFKRGYNRAESQYPSFWRRAATDGSWRIEGGDSPRRIALDVKLAEDIDWPLSQPVEALAAHDAVLMVRIVTPGVGKSLVGASPAAKEALASLVATLPIRAIDFNSAV
jgi:hypothetical protein